MNKVWMAAAFALSLGAMVMPASYAQGGDGGGRPGQGRPGGNRGFGGLTGTIESISDTELVITPMFGGGGRPGGGRPGGGQPQQGGEPPRTITIKLNGETGYSELVDGKEDDLVKGVFVSAVGEGEDTIDAKAIATCEAAPEDTDGAAAMRALFLASMPLRMIAMRGQQGGDQQNRPRIGQALGELINEIPYTVKARGRDGNERDVAVTVADATRYFKVSSIKHGDLVKGRMVSIAPVRQQDGQGGPGAPGGNRQAFEPLQGGDQPPREIIASLVLMMPEMQRPGGGNGAPPQ